MGGAGHLSSSCNQQRLAQRRHATSGASTSGPALAEHTQHRARRQRCRHSINPPVAQAAVPAQGHDAHENGHQPSFESHSDHSRGDHEGIGIKAHSHHAEHAEWGPLRSALHSALQQLRLLQAAHFLSHSLRSALLSAACFAASALCCRGLQGITMLHAGTPSAVAGSALLGFSLVLSGFPAFIDATMQVMHGTLDAHVLMALAGAGSFVLGLPLEGALLFVLFHIAHALEAKFVAAAHTSITSLVDAVPANANVVQAATDDSVQWQTQMSTAVGEVAVGALVAVRPGEAVPLDGTVYEGQALVGQENVTGESLPVLKQPGSTVFSGGVVRDGALVIRTTTAAADSSAARIASITSAALERRAPVDTWLNRLTKRWSQAVIAATLAAFGLLVATGVPLWGSKGAVYRSLGLLTAAAPCALLIVPLAFVCAVAVLSRHGIIVKGAHVLDTLRHTSCVALDKTGTVSEGQLSCTAITHVHGSRTAAVAPLQAAAALSFRGRHPVCEAVLKRLAEQQARSAKRRRSSSLEQVPAVSDFTTQAGAGMSGSIDGLRVSFGSFAYVEPLLSAEQRAALRAAVDRAGSNAVQSVLVQSRAPAAQSNGSAAASSALHIALFDFSDKPRSDSRGVIASLRSMGLRVGVYTGDNESSAHAMARQIGVGRDEVFAALTPERKAELVHELQDQGERVVMVGDGINDAPALARADVGVALAEDTESATAGVAGVVLLHGSAQAPSGQPASILRIAFLLRVARAVRTIVWQNLGLAFCSMVLGAGPALTGLVPLWTAVLLHEGSTVLVALNCCRLLLMRQPQIQAQGAQ